jgi:hypothetical protein
MTASLYRWNNHTVNPNLTLPYCNKNCWILTVDSL